ncbi:MAG: DUF4097 domain-containing protein [Acidobacteria bacterium]|nr:DUF4097 domain-containing protein [Acidobacteriota bacterium]
MLKRSLLILMGLMAVSLAASGQQQRGYTWTEETRREYPMNRGAIVLVDNRVGSVTVEGTDENVCHMHAKVTMWAPTEAVLKEARSSVKVLIRANERRREFHSLNLESGRPDGWSAQVELRLTVPRSVSELTVISAHGRGVDIRNIDGQVRVSTFSNRVGVESTGAPLAIDTVNGNVRVSFRGALVGTTRIASVNGSIEIEAPPRSAFQWAAESLRGQLRAPSSVRGAFDERTPTLFRAAINGGSPSRLITTTATGDVTLKGIGQSDDLGPVAAGRPENQEDLGEVLEAVSRVLIAKPTAREFAFQKKRGAGNLTFEVKVGNVFLGEHRGNVRLTTGAGEIVVGSVIGNMTAVSMGGPIHVGAVVGTVDLDSAAGDVMVVSAVRGGSLRTGGGNIIIRSAGGPITLASGGGDVRVERAMSDVRAETRSGDVVVTVAPGARFDEVDLRSREGNVIITMPAGAGITIDATVLTREGEDANAIMSQFPGLSMMRDVYQGRVRVRARGEINGGGPSVRLFSDGGHVHVRTD